MAATSYVYFLFSMGVRFRLLGQTPEFVKMVPLGIWRKCGCQFDLVCCQVGLWNTDSLWTTVCHYTLSCVHLA